MTLPTSTNEAGEITIDLSKIAHLGLLPILVLALIILILGSRLTNDNKLIRSSQDSLRIEIGNLSKQMDSLNKTNTAIVKLACDKFDPRKIILTEIKCPSQ